MATSIQQISLADWQEQISSCSYDKRQEVIDLISSQTTQLVIDDTVREKVVKAPTPSYFNNFFGTRVIENGREIEEERTLRHPARANLDFTTFIEQGKICNPGDANECNYEYCTVPSPGVSRLPQPVMYRWGWKTEPYCIANWRNTKDFQNFLNWISESRFYVDIQAQTLFGMFAAIQTAGHKWVLETDTNRVPVASSDPRNIWGQYRYSYMDNFFPAVNDYNLIEGLQIDGNLLKLARNLDVSGAPWHSGVSPAGEKIWELWVDSDLSDSLVFQNREWYDRVMKLYPEKLFKGFSSSEGSRTVLMNWALRVMNDLPRFYVSRKGGLVMAKTFQFEDVVAGKEAIFDINEWNNAPIRLALNLAPQAANFIVRPQITQSQGIPIPAIGGTTGWEIWNEYDPVCNKEKNMPYWKKRYELGFEMADPDAGKAMLYRANVFNTKLQEHCNFVPIVTVDPVESTCSVLNIGCDTKSSSNKIIRNFENEPYKVKCAEVACGDSTTYRLRLDMPTLEAGGFIFDCECGQTINAFLYDSETGELDSIVPAKVLTAYKNDTAQGFYTIQFDNAPGAGLCIRYVACLSGESDSNIWNIEAGPEANQYLLFFTDLVDGLVIGDDVDITATNSSGAPVTITDAEVVAINLEGGYYTVLKAGLSLSTLKTYCDVEIAEAS